MFIPVKVLQNLNGGENKIIFGLWLTLIQIEQEAKKINPIFIVKIGGGDV